MYHILYPNFGDSGIRLWPKLLKQHITSHKKVFDRKQAYVEMETSKTNRTRWVWHPNTFTLSLRFANHALWLLVEGCGMQSGG